MPRTFFFLMLALVAGCRPAGEASSVSPVAEPAPLTVASPYFRDVTAESGVQSTCRTGEEADQYTLLESLGSGVAMFDYDGDGLLDLYFPGGGDFTGPDRQTIEGRPGKLYRNLGGWHFRDVTADAGLAEPVFYSH